MNMNERGWLGVLLAAQLALLPIGARADQCMPPPAVFGNLAGGPEWADFDESPFWRPELHDPRWASANIRPLAFKIGGSSADLTSPASVRVVTLDNTVFVSFYVDDEDGPNQRDEVHIGFTQGTSKTAHALKIEMSCDNFTPPQTPLPEAPQDVDPPRILRKQEVTHWKTNDHTAVAPVWTRQSGDAITAQIRGACWNRVIAQSPRWALTLRLEFTGTQNQARKFFFGVKTSNGKETESTIVGSVAPVNPPDGAGGNSIIPPSSSAWERYTAYGPSAACSSGLSVSATNIGVRVGNPGEAPGEPPDAEMSEGDNAFRAVITGAPRDYLGPWEVRAKFRISDWGSLHRRAARWKDISVPPPNNSLVDPMPSTEDPWFWQQPTGSPLVTIDYKCTTAAGQTSCPPLAPTTAATQQLLVEIANLRGEPITKAYALQDMTFVELSKKSQQALISVEGLEHDSPDAESFEVYLQLATRNMPQPSAKPVWLESEAMHLARDVTRRVLQVQRELPVLPVKDAPKRPGKVDRQDALLQKKGQLAPPGAPKQVDPKQIDPNEDPPTEKPLTPKELEFYRKSLEKQNAAAQRDAKRVLALANDNKQLVEGVKVHEVLAMSQNQLFDAIWPTFRIVPYYLDKTSFKNTEGKPEPTLVPMPSFGWYLKHKGSLYGFTYGVEPSDENKDGKPDFELQTVPGKPNWRKLTIPAKGAVRLNVSASAEEHPPGVAPGDTTAPTSGTTTPPTTTGGPGHTGCRPCAVHRAHSNGWYGLTAGFVALALGYRRARRNRGTKVDHSS